MATHSSVLAWRISGMAEPSGLPSMGSHRVGHDCSDLAAAATRRIQQVNIPSYHKVGPTQLASEHTSCLMCDVHLEFIGRVR